MDISDLYLFHLIVLLNPDLSWPKSLLSFPADKVTTGTYNLQSVILKIAPVGLLILVAVEAAILLALLTITRFSLQIKVKETMV